MIDKKEEVIDLLIEHVMYQMQDDFYKNDVTAIDELLRTIPVEKLIGYLPEELSAKYDYLIKTS